MAQNKHTHSKRRVREFASLFRKRLQNICYRRNQYLLFLLRALGYNTLWTDETHELLPSEAPEVAEKLRLTEGLNYRTFTRGEVAVLSDRALYTYMRWNKPNVQTLGEALGLGGPLGELMRSRKLTDWPLAVTEQKYDRVLDLIGPAALKDTFRHMKEGSIVCCTGLLGGIWSLADFDPLMDLPPDAYLTAFHSGGVTAGKMQELLDYIKQYRVEIKAEKVFTLQDVPKAHEYLESADSFGKVVVLNV